jgi:hypothetical protein
MRPRRPYPAAVLGYARPTSRVSSFAMPGGRRRPKARTIALSGKVDACARHQPAQRGQSA